MGDDSKPAGHWRLTDVALVIRKADLDPDTITARLDLPPSAVKAPGIDRWNPGGDTDGQWRYQCDERTTRRFSEQLDIVLKAAEQRGPILGSLQQEGFDLALLVRGFASHDAHVLFSPLEMQRIARLNMPLSLVPSLNER
ncbi:DUF4279 domain-containing protein [Streptomyces sp. NPDC006307]|uniref:DUF4279 domain-containing protein n=1 Tax=Streptomyces sp. NPDC006307 TaxID=3156748 RepID=UPI0033BF7526